LIHAEALKQAPRPELDGRGDRRHVGQRRAGTRSRRGQESDGLNLYLTVVDALLRDRVDYAILHKLYGNPAGEGNDRRYSPSVCTGVEGRPVMGNPDPEKISTSYVERQNLTMRMGMRRFTRLTNGFSKKVENLTHAVSLHYMYYNFGRPHTTLTKRYGKPTTPAMAAGIARYPWSVTQIAELLD
jgi:hypothetical protein